MAARVPSKHGRDHSQDWESSFKDKEKKLKPQPEGRGKDIPAQRSNAGNGSQPSNSSKVGQMLAAGKPHSMAPSGKYDYLREYDKLSRLSSSGQTTENSVDANSEKELNWTNLYSRNRAMAYIKIRRFQEAESGCTEALNLNDQYTKAYSRRSTARKELGKLKESLDDAEFALKSEPQSQELKRQYTEVKSLLEKGVVNKLSKESSSSLQGSEKVVKPVSEVENSVDTVQSRTSNSDGKMIVEMQHNQRKKAHADGKASRELNRHGLHMDGRKVIAQPQADYEMDLSWSGEKETYGL